MSEQQNISGMPVEQNKQTPMDDDPRRKGSWLGWVILMAVVLAGGVVVGARFHQVIGRSLGFEGGSSGAASEEKKLWTCGMHPQVIQDKPGMCPICGMALEPVKADQGSVAATSGERKIKYWWDPMMSPPYISDKPGKSPMGMDLVAVYEDEVSGGVTVRIDPVIVQNMGVRVVEAARGPVKRSIRAVGYLEEAQPNIHDINLRVSGWVEKLHAHTVGMHIRKGDALFELYSPEVQVAAGELIAARRAVEALGADADETSRQNARTLEQVAVQKLEQWGLDESSIEALAKLERAPRTIVMRSPISGDVTEKMIVQGAAVKAGDRVLQVVDHSMLWLDAQIHAQDLAAIKLGQKATARIEGSAQGQVEGQVIFIHPHIDPMTRTAKVRMAVANESLALRPGMYATVRIVAELAADVLQVPREAVIDTGERQVVFVAAENGHFEPRKVKTGLESSEGTVQVLSGVAPGERVVVSGQFLLDSESRMKEAIQKHLARNLLKPTAHTAATQATRPVLRGEWTKQVDAVVVAYLEVAELFGQKEAALKPVDAGKLEAAAKALAAGASEAEIKSLAERVGQAAGALGGKGTEEQRKLFKALSDAVIAMADRSPPTKAAVGRLFVVHCSMAPGTWLQRTNEVANPYYAAAMKGCGEVQREISLVESK